MRNLPSLRAIEAFEAAARRGSITVAASELNLTPSAVSHQVKTLEEQLGVRLFHRSHRRITLSDAGSAFAQLISGALDRIEQASKAVVERGYSDILTVHCAPTFAPSWLMPRLGEFMRAHPEIDMRLHATPEPPDFLRTNTDIAIRYGNGDWPTFYVIPLMEEQITPMCSPALLEKLSSPADIREIAKLPLIHSERSIVNWSSWLEANNIGGINVSRGLRFDRGYLSIQAAVDSLGIALESTVSAERELKSGRLVAPFQHNSVDLEVSVHFLVCPLENMRQVKVRRFHDWIVQAARSA
jgi:LysR family transcriptional regulator, glycine cleavage system transcriptional activator